ncbi:MAG TPA: hypothetical protein VN578_21425 [Candidatus Binatia bacterium]|jgi:hypothetical protein|nr:hypothetical protein [Candidatus Binatia bacterium]
MKQGTPDEIEFIRRRHKVLTIIRKSFLPIAVSGILTMQLLDTPVARKVIGYGLLFGCAALGIFWSFYWRCPVCKKEFSRQSGGKYCEHCETKFEP